MRIEEENLITSITVGGGGGGGGGATSLAQLSDVYLPDPKSGQYLKYNGNKWVAASGGGGSGTSYNVDNVTISATNDTLSVISGGICDGSTIAVNSSTNRLKVLPSGIIDNNTLVIDDSTGKIKVGSVAGGISNINDIPDVDFNPDAADFSNPPYIISYDIGSETYRISKYSLNQNLSGSPVPGTLLYCSGPSSTAGYGEYGHLYIDSSTLKIEEGVLSVIGGDGNLSGLSDVTISSNKQSGNSLVYDGTAGKWANKTLNIEDLGNVSTENVSHDYVLTYDSTYNHDGGWVAKPQSGSGSGKTYSADGKTLTLSDTEFSVIASPALLITYNGEDTQYNLPTVSRLETDEYRFLGISNYNGTIGLEWLRDYTFDSSPTSGQSTHLVSSGALYNCFGSGVDGRTIEVNSSGKLHVIGSSGEGGATELKELSDVDDNLAPNNGQILVYNNGQWEAQTPSGSSTPLTWEEH